MRANYSFPVSGAKGAFTLLELVVVLATVSLLAALLLPALAGTRNDSKTFRCQQNLRQLANAWLMYADENSDRLVNLSTYTSGTPATMSTTNTPWRTQMAGGWVSVSLPYGISANTAQAQRYATQMGYKQPRNNTGIIIDGPLFKYAPNEDVIHCPADFRANLRFGPGNTGPYAWDSYMGAGNLNGEAGGYLKRSQIPHPADRWTWVESAGSQGENLGSFLLNYKATTPNTASFSDSPAAFHNAAADFNFCDGHVELHAWQNRATIDFANSMDPSKTKFNSGQIAGNVDAIWVGNRMPGPNNP